jgi:hypothetical protein
VIALSTYLDSTDEQGRARNSVLRFPGIGSVAEWASRGAWPARFRPHVDPLPFTSSVANLSNSSAQQPISRRMLSRDSMLKRTC